MTRTTPVRADSSAALGVMLALCSVVGVMSAIVLVPVMPQLFVTYRLLPDAPFWLPLLVTVPGLSAALLSPLVGYLGDRIALKWPIVIGLCLFALFGAAPLMLNGFLSILLTRIALGTCQVVPLVLSPALISQVFEGSSRERWLAVQTMASTVSSLVILPICGWLGGSALGWRGAFLIFPSVMLLAGAIAVLPVPAVQPTIRPGQAHGDAMPWRWLAGQCMLTMLGGMAFFAVQFHLGLAFALVGVRGPGSIGLLCAIATAGVVVGSVAMAPARRMLGARLLPAAFACCGALLILMRVFPALVPLMVLAFGAMIACGMLLPTLVVTVANTLPGSLRARGLGLWTTAFAIGQFLSTVVVGAVLARPGLTVLDAFAAVGAGICVLAAGLVVAGRRRSPGARRA